MIFNRLNSYALPHLDEHQHGFRPGRSCETAVAELTQKLYQHLDKRSGKAVALFVDFTKAFDSVNQLLLFRKLLTKYNNDFPPYLLTILLDYFYGREFTIANGDYISSKYQISSGVPAGSVNGPILYSLFVNDIGEYLDLEYLLYADDLCIFTDCNTFEEGVSKLNKTIEGLCKWCDINGVKLNVTKTKWMTFYKAHDRQSAKAKKGEIIINGLLVERVEVFKYLGVLLNSNLSFNEHEDLVEQRVNYALSKLYRLKRFLDVRVMKVLLSSYVTSNIEYAIIIWGVKQQKLYTLQQKINKFLLSYFLPSLYGKSRRKGKLINITKIELNNYFE